MKLKYFIIHLAVLIPVFCFSEVQKYERIISWSGVQQISIGEGEPFSIIRFEGSGNEFENDFLPHFYERFALSNPAGNLNVELKRKIFEPLTQDEIAVIESTEPFTNEMKVTSYIAYDRKQPYAVVSFIPIQKNQLTGFYEKLISFEIEITYDFINDQNAGYKSTLYKENSVLSAGNWYKVAVANTGIHKITYQQLSDLGISIGTIDPRNIRIYGNGGGMLPEKVTGFRYDDLQENAIFVSGEDDGSFDVGDYILFYGESPNELKYSDSDKKLHHYLHLYSDRNYYFITTDLGLGKRIQNITSSSQNPTLNSAKFNDSFHYELEDQNLIGTGRIWYGETFDLNTTFIKELNFPDLDLNSKVHLTMDVAARSNSASSFTVYINNVNIRNLIVPATSSSNPNSDFAKPKFDTTSFDVGSPNFTLKIVYNKPLQSSVGYLNYFTVNVKRNLSFNGGQLIFRDARTAGIESVTEYTLSKVTSNVTIWDITDRINPGRIESLPVNSQFIFRNESNSLHEFLAFDESSFYSVELNGKIENQNLHGLGDYEMIIVTHPSFIDQAHRLAEHHIAQDNMSVLVVKLQDIYNEFSSGASDITAIRDFIKMLYDKASTGNEPRYLLLFGDASYDYKDRVANNSNYVPTWESTESLNPVGSSISDDYFGLLDDDSMVDIGIGRFVVNSIEQAQTAVDKVIHYSTNTDEVMNEWRNIVCLIADDEDYNLHFSQTEDLAFQIDTTNKNINIEKIYLDAYPQESTPSGEKYPKVTEDINNRVNRGALIVNYVGHGGELGLAHERIMTVADINSWNNYDNMPVFLTATCEFSRFDDPKRTSAGESVFLNSNGGGIALFTTARATYAGANAALNKNFFAYTLKETDGEYMRMGDVIRLSKNSTGSIDNTRKFVLLGDPALKFAFPKHDVITSTINSISILENIDTLKALSEVTITGEMKDYLGNKLTEFNGVLFPIVYDKPSKYTTLANDPASSPATFYIQKNPLYKGKASIVNGEWSFTFIVPKDIAYDYGFGKISYYAKTDDQDGAGYFMNIVVGGYNQNASADNEGPIIRLYMNDENFTAGGLTSENPVLFAHVYDDSGINTVGNGIGHDIMATLDESNNFVLNDNYQADLDDFTNGVVYYPFFSLSPGHHNLSLKVWDINNNSATAYTDFIVAESNEMAIQSLLNYPNPFRESTKFTFEHNQADQPLEVKIEVYSLEGQLVHSIGDQYFSDGYRYTSTEWRGTDEAGSKLRQGMYIYKVMVRNYDGTASQETSKLVILR